jgi:TolB-like protein
MGMISELKRRNVLRMAVLYAVAAWLIVQVAGVIIDLANLPDKVGPVVLGLLAIGFPIALIFSWVYEITPGGIKLDEDVDQSESITNTTGRRVDFIVISLLCAAVILFAYDKWWISGSTNKSIAVLAFENMSADPDQEYFSDGISEELLNLLAQTPGLRVISRSSAFSFKGKNLPITAIAEQLNVAHVLEGSVRKVGNRIRITAQLIEASSDSHLWSQSYDRELDDIFAVQDEIAAAISDALKVKLELVADATVQPTSIKAANTDAYDEYLQGRELLRRRGRENMANAIRHFERSLLLDNNFAPAHAQLAIAAALLGLRGESTADEARRIATPHLDRAQELEPDLAEAHAGRALLAHFSGDTESEIEHARKALASNPSYVDAMNWLRISLDKLGRYEEAEATLRKMLVVDPLSLIGRTNYAGWLSKMGRLEEAHDVADQMLAQDLIAAYSSHAITSLAYEGNIAEGLSWALKLGHGNGLIMIAFSIVGEYDEARRMREPVIFTVDVYEGRFDEAILTTQRRLLGSPEDQRSIWTAADTLYTAGRIAEALPLYTRLLDFATKGRPIPSSIEEYRSSNETMMRLALARRQAGDKEGAQAAAQIVRQDHAARRGVGQKNQHQYRTGAMIAAFENDPERVIAAMKSAIQYGLRESQFFDDAMFEDLRGDPRFMALQKKLDDILATEHDKVLQLICFNNPVPDSWQPLPETCEGVEEQPVR